MRRLRERPRPIPERTTIEAAAIAACKVIHGVHGCPCERAPSVCDVMQSAARGVIRIAAMDGELWAHAIMGKPLP